MKICKEGRVRGGWKNSKDYYSELDEVTELSTQKTERITDFSFC
jgi:hypothetical protein